MTGQLFTYKVEYRRRYELGGKPRQLTVEARDADEARERARELDPEMGHTTRSPRRMRRCPCGQHRRAHA